jgi:pseudaminic acid cytidylyltransferase
MSTLAIITARGGSKRIPRKNIKDFSGKPIIAWSIETAIKSGVFDEIMVSTEDSEIAAISKKYGAQIPFIRSAKNADDMTGTEEVILEVLNSYALINKHFDFVCCIYPTTPLMTIARLIESKNKLINGKYDTLFPVVKYGYPIQRALKSNENKIQMVWPEYEIMMPVNIIGWM